MTDNRLTTTAGSEYIATSPVMSITGLNYPSWV